ncbi:MAG TPA: hypothetical protein VME70_15850 [Mycobacteriales bacterium]|nr:hypothetical protein [Mycobacteriales bacterium]
MSQSSTRRRRRSVVLAGLLGTTVFAVTAGLSLGGFSAGITNPTNSYSSGTVVLKEAAGATSCYSTGTGTTVTASNTANCTTIDDFGGAVNQGPGSAVNSQVLNLTNVGTINGATFTVNPSACAATAATNTSPYSGSDTSGFCGKVDITIENDTTGTPSCVYPAGAGACPALSNTYNLSTFGSAGALSLGALAAGSSDKFTVKTQIDSGATNADQGLTASVPMTWTLNQ